MSCPDRCARSGRRCRSADPAGRRTMCAARSFLAPLVDRTEFCSSYAMISDNRYRTLLPIFTKPINRPATLAFRNVLGATCHRAANSCSVRKVSSPEEAGFGRSSPDLTALVAHRSAPRPSGAGTLSLSPPRRSSLSRSRSIVVETRGFFAKAGVSLTETLFGALAELAGQQSESCRWNGYLRSPKSASRQLRPTTFAIASVSLTLRGRRPSGAL